MKIHWKIISEIIPAQFVEEIKNDISFAFDIEGTGLISVNPSKFFKLHPDGKLKAIVVNQAEYLSKGFQTRIVDKGWEIEKKIDNQRIDGFKTFSGHVQSTATINKDNFFEIINQYEFEQIDFINKVVSLYNNFFKRSCFVANNNDNAVNYSLRDKDVAPRRLVWI